MAGVLVSGVVSFEDGAANLRLVPTNCTRPPPATPTTTRVPWPTSNTRCDDEIYQAIRDGKAEIHPTREPMTKRTMQVTLNNIQRALSLKVGAGGGWSVEADLRLLRLLASSKKPYAKGNHAKAIKDADEVLAIKDIDHNILDEAMPDNDGPENMNQTNPGEEAMDVDAPVNSSSSCSSSSSSSTHKSTLRRRVRDLEGMLEDVTQDLWAANETLGLNV
ncbi:unnamed protein product [Symbiodinium necroappetens]|uniref:Uncharacterized protein n=1 Tax=Symbiodinium necroappetens TaxID=1628268 RepID=A0A813C2H3_9DINO|nr:unnamed protein product [Symbiodinium necroappetens]